VAVLFVISGALRQFAGNRGEVRLAAAAGPLSQALAQLWTACPAVRDRVLTERGHVRQHVNIFVDGEDIRYTGGLETTVRDGAEVFLVPAVSGGSRG
jgi:molybdopterin synthase sulfur carrier subunit